MTGKRAGMAVSYCWLCPAQLAKEVTFMVKEYGIMGGIEAEERTEERKKGWRVCGTGCFLGFGRLWIRRALLFCGGELARPTAVQPYSPACPFAAAESLPQSETRKC